MTSDRFIEGLKIILTITSACKHLNNVIPDLIRNPGLYWTPAFVGVTNEEQRYTKDQRDAASQLRKDYLKARARVKEYLNSKSSHKKI
jgi:hypothetical protein